MAASAEYITRLEGHARNLRAVNDRMVQAWIDRDCPVDVAPAMAEALDANQVEAERYEQQASWHRNDNGERVMVWPRVKPWRD